MTNKSRFVSPDGFEVEFLAKLNRDGFSCVRLGSSGITNPQDLITFYYEGSEDDYARLDEATRTEIENNALKVVYDVHYNFRYGK